MPKLGQDMEMSVKIPNGGNFTFSAIRPASLEASEYTLVTVCVDVSGSVGSFKSELENTLKSIVEACKKSPRAENLLLRLVTFNHNVSEVHGFKLLHDIDLSQYSLNCGGNTALFNTTYEAIAASLSYAKTLKTKDFSVNGVVYVMTDGLDNESPVDRPIDIKAIIEKCKKDEEIESLITVLIGIAASSYSTELNRFKNEAGLDQFVDVGDATPQRLAKLAAFVSKSVASQSQALGTGTTSQAASLSF